MSRREEVEVAAVAVMRELHRAMDRFPAFNSPHEGVAVIEEEYLELRKHVYEGDGRCEAAIVEAVQLSAMAMRYALELGGPR